MERIRGSKENYDFSAEIVAEIEKGEIPISGDEKDMGYLTTALETAVKQNWLTKEGDKYRASTGKWKEKGEKIIKALSEREDTQFLVVGEADAKTSKPHGEQAVEPKIKRTAQETAAIKLEEENKKARAEMEELFANPKFHKQTKEEFEEQLERARLSDAIKDAESRVESLKIGIDQEFNRKIQEIEDEISVLRDKIYSASTEETKSISKEIADLITKEVLLKSEDPNKETENQSKLRDAEIEVKFAKVDFRLQEYFRDIRNNGEIEITDEATVVNNPNSTIGDILGISGHRLSEEMINLLNEEILPDENGNVGIELTADNQMLAKSDEGFEVISKITKELKLAVTKEFFKMAHREASPEERLQTSAKTNIDFRELIGFTLNDEIIQSFSDEFAKYNLDISASGEVLALNPDGEAFLKKVSEVLMLTFRQEFIDEVQRKINSEFKENDALLHEAKRVSNEEDKKSRIAFANRRTWEFAKKHLSRAGREEIEEINLREARANEAIRRRDEIELAKGFYEDQMREYARLEAEIRADIIQGLAQGEQYKKRLLQAINKANEFISGTSLHSKDARRLIELLGKDRSEFEKEHKPLECREVLRDEVIPQKEQEGIAEAALAETARTISENLGIIINNEDINEISKSLLNRYLDTFVSEEAAARKLKQLVGEKAKNVDMTTVRDLLGTDIVRLSGERKNLFEEIIKQVAKRKNEKLAKRRIDEAFNAISVEYSLKPEDIERLKQEAQNELLIHIEEGYGNTKVPDRETAIFSIGTSDSDSSDLYSTAAREISSWNRMRSNGSELNQASIKKQKAQTLIGIFFSFFTGGVE